MLCHATLLYGEDKLLESVSHELQIFQTHELTFFDSSIDREEARLINFLRLDQSVDPVLLPRL